MAHSNQVREFLLTDHGVELRDVYVGLEGMLTGSMRLAQEAREAADAVGRQQEIERLKRELARKREALEAAIRTQRAVFEAEQAETNLIIQQQTGAVERLRANEQEMGRSRGADSPTTRSSKRRGTK